jgi:hypothetical protein
MTPAEKYRLAAVKVCRQLARNYMYKAEEPDRPLSVRQIYSERAKGIIDCSRELAHMTEAEFEEMANNV